MDDIDKLLTKGELFAQAHVVLALMATHPDLLRLKTELLQISERHMATILAGSQTDASIGAYRLSLERWLKWMDSAARHQGMQTTPPDQTE